MKTQQQLQQDPIEQFVTMLFDNNSTAKDFRVFLKTLDRQTFKEIIENAGHLLFSGPVTTEEVLGHTKLDANCNNRIEIDNIFVQIPQEYAKTIALGQLKELDINVPYKDLIGRKLIFTPQENNQVIGKISQKITLEPLAPNLVKPTDDFTTFTVELPNKLGGEFNIKLVKTLHNFVPQVKINQVLQFCKKHGVEKVQIDDQDYIEHLRGNVVFDVKEGIRNQEYANSLVKNSVSLPVDLLQKSNYLSGFEGFFKEFMYGSYSDFRQFVTDYHKDIPQFITTQSKWYMANVKNINANQALDACDPCLLTHIGRHYMASKGYKIPYLDQKLGFSTNVNEVVDLKKKLAFIEKSMRGYEAKLGKDGEFAFNQLMSPEVLELYYNKDGKFSKTIQNFKDSNYTKFAPLIEDGRNQKKESLVSSIVPKLKDMNIFVQFSKLYKGNVTDLKSVEDTKLIDSLAKIFDVNIPEKALKEDYAKVANELSILVPKYSGNYVSGNKYLEQFISSLNFINQLGSFLKYKTTQYDGVSFKNFIDYVQNLAPSFGKIIIKKLQTVANDHQDQKLDDLMSEYDLDVVGEVNNL